MYRIANEVVKKNSMEIRNYKDKNFLGGHAKNFLVKIFLEEIAKNGLKLFVLKFFVYTFNY